MIKIGIVSDLHSEFWRNDEREQIAPRVQERLAEADLILMPGDIGTGVHSIATARDLFPDQPVYMVAGNHEFYRGDYDRVLTAMQGAATDNIHFLHKSVAEIIIADTPIRIIGTTLWTDFDLHGTVDLSLFHARRSLNDFYMITYGDHILTPQDTLEWHRDQRAWMLARLTEIFDGVTILMTHHAPVSFAIGPRYVDDRLSPCFASRLETALLGDGLPLVVWGHTHHCVDRTIETTRFVSCQTGYPARLNITETGEFGQIIELAAT